MKTSISVIEIHSRQKKVSMQTTGTTYTDLRGRRGYLIAEGTGAEGPSCGAEDKGNSTMPKKSSLVNLFSSKTCMTSL